MIHLSTSLSYYKRKDIQEKLVESCTDREVAFRFESSFGKRPDVLLLPGDVLEIAMKGVTSFHVSEERWENPLSLQTGLSKKDLDALRIGWDLVLDVDAKNLEISKIVTFLLIQILEENGVKHYSLKYSGNKGFHIGVPFESFPSTIGEKKTSDLFPEAPKKIANYLIVESCKKIKIVSNTVDFNGVRSLSIENVKNLLGEDAKKVFSRDKSNPLLIKFDPISLINLDTVLISSRHMYRAVYSLHEKSGLASIPVTKDELLNFDKASAKPEVVKGDRSFLTNSSPNEADSLIVQAFDSLAELSPSYNTESREKDIKFREFSVPEEAVQEIDFPPCIKKMLDGLDDGKKRALFVLINFLRSLGWDKKSVEERLKIWNKKNQDPLSESYITWQVNYGFSKPNVSPPPNCDNPGYYQDLGVKCSNDICGRVKNPVVFSSRRSQSKKKREKKSE